jgi:hypothetical protein
MTAMSFSIKRWDNIVTYVQAKLPSSSASIPGPFAVGSLGIKSSSSRLLVESGAFSHLKLNESLAAR